MHFVAGFTTTKEIRGRNSVRSNYQGSNQCSKSIFTSKEAVTSNVLLA